MQTTAPISIFHHINKFWLEHLPKWFHCEYWGLNRQQIFACHSDRRISNITTNWSKLFLINNRGVILLAIYLIDIVKILRHSQICDSRNVNGPIQSPNIFHVSLKARSPNRHVYGSRLIKWEFNCYINMVNVKDNRLFVFLFSSILSQLVMHF